MRSIVAFLALAALAPNIAGAAEKPRYEVIVQNESKHEIHVGIRDGYRPISIAVAPESTETRDYETSVTTVGVFVLCTTRYVHHLLRLQPRRNVIRVTVNANCGERISY